jgi:hypothetical protein
VALQIIGHLHFEGGCLTSENAVGDHSHTERNKNFHLGWIPAPLAHLNWSQRSMRAAIHSDNLNESSTFRSADSFPRSNFGGTL